MGRKTNYFSPLDASPRELIPDTDIGMIYRTGLEISRIEAGSATASLTILSLQGPGVLNYLAVRRNLTSTKIGKVVAVIDGDTCYSASATIQAGFQVVGTNSPPYQYDRVVFRENVTVFLELNAATATLSAFVATSWRLTNG